MPTKEEYIDMAATKFKEWTARLDELKRRGEGLGAEAKEEFSKRMSGLDGKKEELRYDLDRLKAAGGDAWRELQKGVDGALDELKRGVEAARSKFM